MKIFAIISALLTILPVHAFKYDYNFKATPVSQALVEICRNHPDINITFIYKELTNYKTTAAIKTNDTDSALRMIVGMNPVTITKNDSRYYIEALQHGKFTFSGLVRSEDMDPLSAATIILLSPRDSSFITYGITDEAGLFHIPCDKSNVIAKISRVSYKNKYYNLNSSRQDTIELCQQPINLNSINVEAKNILTYSDKTIYIPTQRQKNASQTAIELLARIPSPQIKVNMMKGTVKTFSEIPVALFIDYLPASAEELTGMNIQDVKKIEFFENPSDPRFGNQQCVVNFVMQKYEYGGYTKFFGSQGIIVNTGNAQITTRMQYKSMQYDLMGSAYSTSSTHDKMSGSETYRLIQPDGGIKTVERNMIQTDSKNILRTYSLAFKATYRSENITAASSITGNFLSIPHNDAISEIYYSPKTNENSATAVSTMEKNSCFVNYTGAYYFDIKDSGIINFTPSFTHTHTNQSSLYQETGFNPYQNNAVDDSNDLGGTLSYQPSFKRYGTLSTFIKGSHINNRTTYSGTAQNTDKSNITDLSADVNYSISNERLYFYLGMGWKWTWLTVNQIKEFQNKPNIEFSLRYLFREKHNIRLSGASSPLLPQLIYRSEQIVQSSPYFYYTGNPALKHTDWVECELNYTYIPGSIYSLGLRMALSDAINRYVFDYESTSYGIIRTLKQPLGKYYIASVGFTGSLSLFNKSLEINGAAYYNHYHNGQPYNIRKSSLRGFLSAYAYLNDFNINGGYYAAMAETAGFMTGYWMNLNGYYYISAGWSHKNINIRLTAENFAKWNWESETRKLTSKYYDFDQSLTDSFSHASFQISVTYTFNYGKKIDSRNELRVQGRASSGILE